MKRPVTAGVDGSAESLTAADWAAREAERRGAPLDLVQVEDGPPHHTGLPELDVPAARESGALEKAARVLSYGHPALRITVRRVPGAPAPALVRAAADSETLVLGSRGFTAFAGFLVGSVALAVAAASPVPVVLVRSGSLAEDEHVGGTDSNPLTGVPVRRVLLGLDPHHACDDLIAYAFEAATARNAPLHVVHTWLLPPLSEAYGALEAARTRRLDAALRPWRHKYPRTETTVQLIHGRAAHHLLRKSADASLLVIGRRADGGHRLGPTAHSLIHRAVCPVGVVAHG
ncbi:universal stress protein [Streptomyces sp. NPDC050504]|uniref:universal stress protein n=1 Tax=Streptomyces sp. NPDC050504 TaxID=3365618 RepID=UPI00379063BA